MFTHSWNQRTQPLFYRGILNLCFFWSTTSLTWDVKSMTLWTMAILSTVHPMNYANGSLFYVDWQRPIYLYAVTVTRSIFSKILTYDTTHSSPVRERYELVSIVSLAQYKCCMQRVITTSPDRMLQVYFNGTEYVVWFLLPTEINLCYDMDK